MKAKIRKTGEIVDVTRGEHGFYVTENLVGYTLSELDFDNEENEHWQDVRERAAIAAMQGLLSNARKTGSGKEYVEAAIEYADALVEELKKK
jgi:hypothetical protein